MTTELDRVKQEIDEKKADIGATLERLEDKAHAAARKGARALDLKRQFSARPWLVLAGAVGVGALIGRKAPPMQAIVVGLSKPTKEKKQKSTKSRAPHPAIEQGQRILLSSVVPGLVGALLKRYTGDGR